MGHSERSGADEVEESVEMLTDIATESLDSARDDGRRRRSWEQAAHLFGLDDPLHTDGHCGCAMRHPVVLRAPDHLRKRMLENAEEFVSHF